MMQQKSQHASNLKSVPAEFSSQQELYTIPSSSSWFSWSNIHLTERKALKEFFDGSSFTRTPKFYKEYRDFIINKFREDPSRRLTFTEVRKSLVGDVSLLRKVFNCLEVWGLINFNVDDGAAENKDDREGGKVSSCEVRVEEGAPVGVRVVGMPNSLKHASMAAKAGKGGLESGVRFKSLASYSDVFNLKGFMNCERCNERCGDSGHYKCTKESSVLCTKCFKNGNYSDSKAADDFKFIECTEKNGICEAAWTEEETLLLLESVLKYGDDWELVARSVKTKSKLECISMLTQLPFGDFILGSEPETVLNPIGNSSASSVKQVLPFSSPPQSEETIKVENLGNQQTKDAEQNADGNIEGPPLKKKCITSSSLLEQVARLSSTVSPHVRGAAAEAAISAVCEENQCSREIFGDYRSYTEKLIQTSIAKSGSVEVDGSDTKTVASVLEAEKTFHENNAIPTLQLRSATATALGAAAARAKLLADREDREIEQTIATMIETQIQKLHSKLKLFEDLESMMDKEHTWIEEVEELITTERISLLQRAFELGLSRWRDSCNL